MAMTLIISMSTVTQTSPEIRYVLDHRFITSRDCLDGRRIGNLMFNYASLLGIAKRNNLTPILPDSFHLGNTFELGMRQVPPSDLDRFVSPFRDHEEYGRRSCAYDMSTEHLSQQWNYRLVGYFQSWRYFDSVETELRKHFRFKAPILKEARTFLSKDVPGNLQGMDVVKVGVHVRRGDLLLDKRVNFGYTVAPVSYFRKAMAYFQKKYPKLVFIVCSHDMVWTKENVIGENVVYSEKNSAAVDLAILSLCDHMVMSVGSFSWWAAWLANGTTFYYEKWPRPVSMLEYHVDKKQYFPTQWTPLS